MILEPGRWTSEQLVEHIRGCGIPDVTERQLETWRQHQLIPRPVRTGQQGRTPIWTSPPETAERLLQLCRLRRDRRITDTQLLRLLMWVTGQDYPLDVVRADLEHVLAHIADEVEGLLATIIRKHDIQGSPEDVRHQAIVRLADQAALMRGVNTVVTRFRSAKGHRLPGFRVITYMFIEGQTPPCDLGNGEDVERTIGVLPRAKIDSLDGEKPWHDGETDLEHMARVNSLPAWRAAAHTATDEDLLYARHAVKPLTQGLAFIARVLNGLTGNDRFAGLSLYAAIPQSTYTEAGVIALALTLLNSESRDNLIGLVDNIDRTHRLIGTDLKRLLQIPGWLLDKKSAGHPVEQVERLRRVMDQFRPRPAPRKRP